MPVFDISGRPLFYLNGLDGSMLSKLCGCDSKIIESGYVKDGLSLWLDGEFNSGEGAHLDEPTVWKDLSGNSYDFTLNNVSANDKAMSFDGSSSYAVNESNVLKELLTGLKERTIEIVCKLNNTASVQTVFLGYGNTVSPNTGAAGLWYRPASGGFKVGSWDNSPPVMVDAVSEMASYSVAYGDDELNDFAFYQNNSGQTVGDIAGNMYNVAVSIGARLTNDGTTWQYMLNGEICCIRVYNRKLSDKERLYNWLIDKARFGIIAPSNLTVMSFNIQRWKGINADESIMSAIFRKYNPDLVGFQEYDTVNSPSDLAIEDYLKSFWGYLEVGELTSANFSKAIASHHFMSSVESVDYTNLNPNAERRSYHKTYIELGGKKIAVFNTHLDVSSSKNSEGVQYKVLQAQELCEVMSNEEYFILIGDFNTTCDSTEHADYINQLKPFADAGFNLANCCEEFGFNNTWTDSTITEGTWYPTDNIITSPNITINQAVVDTQKIEKNTDAQIIDHLPLVAYLTVN